MPIGSSTGSVLGTVTFAPGAPGGAGGPGGAAPPTPGTGWELKVVSATDYSTLLTWVPDRLWTSLTTADLLNSQAGGSQGSGTVVLNMDDPWWSTVTLTDSLGTHPAHYLLDAEHLWQLWQNGVCRFEFLGETITETLVQQGEGRLVTVTGPDTSQVLNWASAMPTGFPGNIVYKTDALQDSFSEINAQGALVLDTGLWNASSAGGLSINPSGSAQITGASPAHVLGSQTWDLSNSLLSAQVTPIVSPDLANRVLNGSQVTQMYCEDTGGSGYYVLIGLSGTSLYAQYNGPDGTSTKVIDSAAGYTSVQQNTGAYSYWQISHASGFFFFWTSPDGQNWTQVYSHAANWTPSSVGVYFSALYTGSTTEWATVTSINSNVVTSSLGGPTYLGEPIMSVFLQTLEAAQKRGTVPWVTTHMTAQADSYGNPWTDTNNVQIQNGTTLFQLLVGQAAMINADWKMFPGFELRVGIPNQNSPSPNNSNVTLGFDRSQFVRFYEAGGETAKTRQRARNQIVNLLAAINSDGETISAQNATSITSWSQREAWVQAAAQVTQNDLAVVADAAVLANDSEILSWTLQIRPNQPGRTIYQDFQVGDWVGLERPDYSAVDAVRVVGIALTIDQDGNEVHELTLVSYMQWLTQNLLYIQQKMGGGFVSAAGTTAISGNAQGSTLQAPTVFNERLGALGGSGTSGAPMVYNAATGNWVPAGTVDPVSSQTVNLAVTGQGSGTVVGPAGVTVGTTGANPSALNTNYNFNSGTTGWAAVTGTLTTQSGSSGPGGVAPDTNIAKLVPTANGSGVFVGTATSVGVPFVTGIVAGVTYNVTADVNMATQATMTLQVKVDWYNSKKQFISSSTSTAGPISASAWQQVTFGCTAPAGATQCNIFIGPTTAVTTNPLYVTDFYIYNSSAASGVPNSSGTGGSSTATLGSGGTTVTDGTGTVRAVTGLQYDGTITHQSFNAPAPLAPSAPVLTSTMLGINVAWDGLLSGSAAPLLDFLQVVVHASTTSGFTPSTATQVGTFTTAGNLTLTQLTAGTTYYVVFVAYNDSGVASAASAQASAAPQSVSQNIPNGSISAGQLNFSASGVNVTFSGSIPSSANVNDLWYNTGNGNQLSVCNTGYTTGNGVSGDWTAETFGTSAITAGSITTSLLAANAVVSGKIAAGTITAINLAVGTTTQQNIYAAGGDTSGWTGHGGTLTGLASGLPAGAPYPSCFKLSTDGSTSAPAVYGNNSTNGVVAGLSYMATAWVFSANTAAQLGFVWLNSSGGTISSSLTPTTITASTWTQITAIATAPAGAVSCYLVCGLQGTPASNTLIYATEIKLFSPFNGGIIQAGSIATAQLAAGSVTTSVLAAGAVTTNTLAANAVTSAKIAAGTITASDLAVGGTYNQNVYFAGGDTTGCTGHGGTLTGTTGAPAGAPYGTNAAQLSTDGTTAQPSVFGPTLSVTPGSYYMAQAWVYSASTSAIIGFDWLDSNKTFLSTTVVTVTVSANTWTQISAIELAPTGGASVNPAAFCYLRVGLSGTPAANTVIYAQEALVIPPLQGGLIEAGTVDTQQLAAGSVVAGVIAGGAIDGMTLNGNVINAAQIVGDTVVLQGANDGVYCYGGAATQIVKNFSTAGAGTWAVPSNVSTADVYCQGGGGGGSSYNAGGYGGGGGGGGGCGFKTGMAVSGTMYYSVGAGGAHDASGSDTWFNSSNTETGAVFGGGGSGSSNQWGANGGGFGGGSGGFSGGNGGNSRFGYATGGGGGGAAGGGGAGFNGSEGIGSTGGVGGSGGPSTSGSYSVAGGGAGGRGSDQGRNTGGDGGAFAGGAGGGGAAGGIGGGGARGKLILVYTPTSSTLSAYLTGAAGTEPVGGASVIAGVGAENLLLFGSVNPSTPATGDVVFYTNSNVGTPTYKTSSGYFGAVSGAVCNVQSFTANTSGATNITAAHTVPANDANVATCYRIKTWGIGSYTSGSVNWWQPLLFGVGAGQVRFASLPGTFTFDVEASVVVLTTGATGTANFMCRVIIGDSSQTANPNAGVGFNGEFSSSTAMTVDTTSATTFSIECAFNGTASVTGRCSTFERIGP